MHTTATDTTTLRIRDTVIPRIGLGTWEIEGSAAEEAVRDALELGYRHIDTARAYGNEDRVGKAVAESEVDRDGIFLTTKLWFEEIGPRQIRDQIESSLRDLRTDYVDLLLLHWPNPEVPIAETLATMAELQREGKTREIGVSNFPTVELAEAVDASPIPLLANQIEYHPYLDQTPVLDLANRLGVLIEAYSPLAHGGTPGDAELEAIGEKYGKSGVQVGLRWLIEQPGVVALPRSSSSENRRANLDVFDFELDDSDRERIKGLARPDGRQIDPEFAPDWD